MVIYSYRVSNRRIRVQIMSHVSVGNEYNNSIPSIGFGKKEELCIVFVHSGKYCNCYSHFNGESLFTNVQYSITDSPIIPCNISCCVLFNALSATILTY
ncbi:hypothetical protein CEXT_174041 [Caerostris extrusa]|uniref:Uncharacterized protein n=1 Tax=Caerostris extrusa TaxID=172846 RepID=A0AAV4R7H5_CAEEX|nr:hypothetical protein CEXT_174041 [Caerostris extrusa]